MKTGEIKIDKGKIKEEAHLDGKYIISTSDDTLTPEDVALGFKQLLEVERAFRTLKTSLDLRPVYHRKVSDALRASLTKSFEHRHYTCIESLRLSAGAYQRSTRR